MDIAVTTGNASRRNVTTWSRRLGAVALVVVVAVSVHALISGFSGSVGALGHLDAAQLLLAGLCELASYWCMARLLRRIAGRADLRPGAALRVVLVVFGFGIVTPASPAEGLALGTAELQHRGMSTRRSALTFGYLEWLSAAAFVALTAATITVAGLRGHLPAGLVLPFVASAALLVGAVLGVTLLVRHARGTDAIVRILYRLRWWQPRPPLAEQRSTAAAWHAESISVAGSFHVQLMLIGGSIAVWTADALCLVLALKAAGVHAPLDALLLAYVAGVLASEIPFVPGGIGLVEAAIPLVLVPFGVSAPLALAGAIAYRVLGTLLPAATGAACIPTLRSVRHRRGLRDLLRVGPSDQSLAARPTMPAQAT